MMNQFLSDVWYDVSHHPMYYVGILMETAAFTCATLFPTNPLYVIGMLVGWVVTMLGVIDIMRAQDDCIDTLLQSNYKMRAALKELNDAAQKMMGEQA